MFRGKYRHSVSYRKMGRLYHQPSFRAIWTNLRRLTGTSNSSQIGLLLTLTDEGLESGVQFEELDASIAKFNELLCRYIRFLTGDGYISLEATILSSWQRIFEVPLRRPAEPL